MDDSEWDRVKWEWVSERELMKVSGKERKPIHRYAHAHEDFDVDLGGHSEGFTTESCCTYRLYNKNKDLA